MTVQDDSGTNPAQGQERELSEWTTPSVKRMKAGDAEDGYDPIVPDAGITKS